MSMHGGTKIRVPILRAQLGSPCIHDIANGQLSRRAYPVQLQLQRAPRGGAAPFYCWQVPCYVMHWDDGCALPTIPWSKGMRPETEGMQIGRVRAYALYSAPNSLCSMYSSTWTRFRRHAVACRINGLLWS